MRVVRKKYKTTTSPKKAEKTLKGISAKLVDSYLRFLLFLTAIGMVYIWNTHYAVKQVRKLERLKVEVKDLKSKYLMRESTLRAGMRMSEVKNYVDTLGLRPLQSPPYRLTKSVEDQSESSIDMINMP